MGFNPMTQRTIRGWLYGDAISALQKACRRSEEDAAVYWAAELCQSGFGNATFRRLEIICSEDIGVAWPEGPAVIASLRASYDREVKDRKKAGGAERIFAIHAAMLLARAPKSRRVDVAAWATFGCEDPLVTDLPDEALDVHSPTGQKMGRRGAKGDRHWFEQASVLIPPATPEHDDSLYEERMMRSTKATWNVQGKPGEALLTDGVPQLEFEEADTDD